MTKITLNTKLQELNLSKETIEYWNNNIVNHLGLKSEASWLGLSIKVI